jgi:hypothetical protein
MNYDLLKLREFTNKSIIKRVLCLKWWKRWLRVYFSYNLENLERELGLVNANKGIYISNDSFYRWSQQQARNEAVIKKIEAVNGFGEVVDLKTLIDSSVSNPVNRRHELMTRLRGCEEYAESVGDVGVFYTLTTPSRFHAQGNVRNKSRVNVTYANKKFDGSTPKQANKYLQNIWRNIRANFSRNKINFYGFKIIEPHHDGTPHWHIMLFCKPIDREYITFIIKQYAMAENPTEAGANRHRFTAVKIDNKRGSASGYLAKYIAKAIDGHKVDWDLYGKNSKDSALRVRAWASTHGFRQFDSFGLPPIGLWRELRRLANQTFLKAQIEREKAQAENKKIDIKGGFGEFSELLAIVYNGEFKDFIVQFRDKFVQNRVYLLKEFNNKLNEYGDFVKSKVVGLVIDFNEYITRSEWILQFKDRRNGANSPARTCINKCTQSFNKKHPFNFEKYYFDMMKLNFLV